MIRLAMNQLTTFRWSFEEDVRNYLANGFEGIGIWRAKLADHGTCEAQELLAESELAVSSLHWAGGFTGTFGFTYEEAVVDALDAIALAEQLRAQCLVIHSGAQGSHIRPQARRCLVDGLKAILPIAEELGVTLALEPMHAACAQEWSILTDVRETLRIIQALKSPALKMVFDCYHSSHERAMLRMLPELVPHLALVQLGDARGVPQAEQSRCLLGEGCLPIAETVHTLLDAGYQGFFEIELMGEELEGRDYSPTLAHSRHTFDDLVTSPQTR